MEGTSENAQILKSSTEFRPEAEKYIFSIQPSKARAVSKFSNKINLVKLKMLSEISWNLVLEDSFLSLFIYIPLDITLSGFDLLLRF